MIKKIIAEGADARAKLLKGATTAGKLVGVTLGPKGRNAILQTAYKAPNITNDGITLLRSLILQDEIEDLGCQTITEASLKTNDRAGDGTTSTAVFASKIISECAEKIKNEDKLAKDNGLPGGSDVVSMSRAIIDAKDIVLEKLKKMAKPVKKGDIKNIISTSLGKIFPEYITKLTEIVETVGLDGYISVEDNWNTKYGVETELAEGMRFRGSYATPFMITNAKKEAIWEDTMVMVCNYQLEALQPMVEKLLAPIIAKGIRKFVIIAEGYSVAMVKSLAGTIIAAREGDTRLVQYLAIKAPALTTEQLQDVSVYVDAKFVDKNTADDALSNVVPAWIGYAKKVVVNEDEVIILGGRGKTADRIALLKKELDAEKDPSFAEQTKRRIAALKSGSAIIRVGAATEPERVYLKMKIEDAKNAAKAALAEGVVPGGGMALKEIAEELGEKNILYKPLCSLYEKIKENCGGELKVPATVIDPVKVTRLVVENGCSVASQLITAEVAISKRNKTLWDELDGKLSELHNEDSDFRSDENQDQGFN